MNNPFELLEKRLLNIEAGVDTLKDLLPKISITEKEEKYIDADQVCKMWGISRVTLWHWEKKGVIDPPRKIGRLKRYKLSDVKNLGEDMEKVKENEMLVI